MELTPVQQDAITELMNIAAGRAAAALAGMLNLKVTMSVSQVRLLNSEELMPT